MHAFYDKVTDRARKALESANIHARTRRNILVTNTHILWGLCEEGNNVATQVLKNLKVNVRRLQDHCDNHIGYGKYDSHNYGVPYAQDACLTICRAIDFGKKVNHIGCQHFLLSLLADIENPAGRFLNKVNVTQELVLAEIKAIVKPLVAAP